jgi:hypothetical protein
VTWREFARRRDGLVYAIDGGLWLHRFVLGGRPMAHLVSSDQGRLLAWGREAGLDLRWIQYKPLKDPRTGVRVPMWHWDLWGELLPARGAPRQVAGGGGAEPEPRR